eukprot:6491498-Amphidinium_carterae.2
MSSLHSCVFHPPTQKTQPFKGVSTVHACLPLCFFVFGGGKRARFVPANIILNSLAGVLPQGRVQKMSVALACILSFGHLTSVVLEFKDTKTENTTKMGSSLETSASSGPHSHSLHNGFLSGNIPFLEKSLLDV